MHNKENLSRIKVWISEETDEIYLSWVQNNNKDSQLLCKKHRIFRKLSLENYGLESFFSKLV